MAIKHVPYWFQYQMIKNSDKHIICESYMNSKLFWFQKNNWGDDLNKYMFEFITGKTIVNLPVSRLFFKVKKSYALIGSILSFYSMEGKVIYGTGLMNPKDKLTGNPKQIASVRGPKTRKALLDRGYDCPEHYGDPALLLPLFYESKREADQRGSLILNMGTSLSENTMINKLVTEMNLKIIDMRNYEKWTDVIDEIASSKYVISESLHGLIVAETYGVPNVWVEFKEHPDYWNFKFEDYYESVGKEERIIKLQNTLPIEEIEKKINNWRKADIDYKKLLSYFPFNIECEIHKELLGE